MTLPSCNTNPILVPLWLLVSKDKSVKEEFYHSFPMAKSESKAYYKRLPGMSQIHQLICSYFKWFNLWKEAQVITGVVTFLLFLEMTVAISFQSFLATSSFIESTGQTKSGKSDDVPSDYWKTINSILITICSIGISICVGNASHYLIKSVRNRPRSIIFDTYLPLSTSHNP